MTSDEIDRVIEQLKVPPAPVVYHKLAIKAIEQLRAENARLRKRRDNLKERLEKYETPTRWGTRS